MNSPKKIIEAVNWNKKLFDFLKKPIITEKTTKLIEKKQYTFNGDTQLTKKQIKFIFSKYYNLSIKSIKTFVIQRKKRIILQFTKDGQPQEIPLFNTYIKNDSNKKN
uniref:Large ribosomal subunit protein uL23c n=1 Tax=Tydemania expeditionis TaxID=325645 RepID=A0A0D6E1L6_TYDEX|nr:50S ribosomal protein L23 [Tydemania expeditionis]CEO91119.1 50S ribosomal protein L23 [Tydemania expeditionis]